ncbi:glycosyltransferase [Azospirillum sp. sgz302134]
MRRVFPADAPNILVLSRGAVVSERAGSSTYFLAILSALIDAGCVVRMVSTEGCRAGRKPWMRIMHDPRRFASFQVTGHRQIGDMLVRWNSLGSYARAFGTIGLMAADRVRQRLKPGAPAWRKAPPWDTRLIDERELAVARRMIRRHRPDVIIANYAYMTPLFDLPEAADARKVVVMHDLLSARAELLRASGMEPDAQSYSIEEEVALLNKADHILAIQPEEQAILRARLPNADIILAPMPAMPRPAPAHPQQPGRCLFVGTKNPLNQQGLSAFLEHGWPAVRRRVPNATLHVCGQVCGAFAEVPDGVVLRGIVPDLDAEYDAAEVSVVPIFAGTGLKVKLVEAIGQGRAIVTTTHATRGLEDVLNGAVEITDSPERMGEIVADILESPDRRRAMEQATRAVADGALSPQSCFHGLLDVAQRSRRVAAPAPDAGFLQPQRL